MDQELVQNVQRILHSFIVREAEQFDRIKSKELRTDDGYTSNRDLTARAVIDAVRSFDKSHA